MEAGLDDTLVWGSLAGGFAIAYPFAFLANRYMIARGKGTRSFTTTTETTSSPGRRGCASAQRGRRHARAP
jgi:hypothetical protein